jgi:hypothetical protein
MHTSAVRLHRRFTTDAVSLHTHVLGPMAVVKSRQASHVLGTGTDVLMR